MNPLSEALEAFKKTQNEREVLKLTRQIYVSLLSAGRVGERETVFTRCFDEALALMKMEQVLWDQLTETQMEEPEDEPTT